MPVVLSRCFQPASSAPFRAPLQRFEPPPTPHFTSSTNPGQILQPASLVGLPKFRLPSFSHTRESNSGVLGRLCRRLHRRSPLSRDSPYPISPDKTTALPDRPG